MLKKYNVAIKINCIKSIQKISVSLPYAQQQAKILKNDNPAKRDGVGVEGRALIPSKHTSKGIRQHHVAKQ